MTDPETYARVRAVFHEVCDLDPEDRARTLAALGEHAPEIRREVERLLESMDRADTLSSGIERLGASAAPVPSIAGYTIVRPIGEGGMGVVYEAEQHHPRRRVALKVIRPGLATGTMTRRFRREAEVLGRLKHPGIAQIYGVGVGEAAGGSAPYIAMELIEGDRLTEHATRRGLPARRRLELAAKVCDAVEHAHQRGVIHRDIKPANILVDADGQPKILDFGVARLTEHDLNPATMQTEPGRIIGTASYMSPEQASGDPDELDTRSDVYALGVVVYELLTGRLPFEIDRLALPEAIRVIREEDPTRAASVVATLRGDVDTILAKALERDKDRRYQSASELGADIRRHLRDEPIVARPPSTVYQLRKFARRNKTLVGGFAATLLALSGGLAATTVALRGESRARAETERSLERARAASDFMERILLGLSPRQAHGRDTELLREMLDDAAVAAREEIEHPPVRAEMLAIVGRTYQSIFEFERAAPVLEQSVELYAGLGEHRHGMELADARLDLAEVLLHLGGDERAESLFLSAITSVESAGDTHRAMHAHRQYAEFVMDRGRWAEALEHVTVAASHADGASELDLGRVAMLRGAILRRLARFDEAGEAYAASLEHFENAGASIEISSVLNSLALLAKQRNDTAEALRLYRESIELRDSVDARANPDTAASLSNLGKLLGTIGRHEEAREALDRAVDMHRALYGEDHYVNAYPLVGLAQVERELGHHEASLRAADRAVELFTAHFGEDHPSVVTALLERGECRRAAGNEGGAEADYRRAIRTAESLGLDPVQYQTPAWIALGAMQGEQGRVPEARSSLARAAELGASDPPTLESIRALLDGLPEE